MADNSATATAFEAGFEGMGRVLAERRQRQQQLADEERQLKAATLYDRGHEIASRIPQLSGDARQKAFNQLTDIDQSIAELYHPVKAPGALQKDWDFLARMITRKPPPVPLNVRYDASATPDITLPAQTQSASMPSVHGAPASSLSVTSAPLTLPGHSADVRPAPALMTRQQRQTMAQRDQARQSAALDVAAAGLTPEQQSQQTLAQINRTMTDYDAARKAAGLPPATSEERAAVFSDLVSKQYGFSQTKPVWKEYASPDGTKQWFDASRPDLIPPGWNASGGESADTRKRADYDAYVRTHPGYDKTFEQWSVEQSQQGRLAVPTNRDDRYIAIEQKKRLGQPVTADEQAYTAAYDLYISKRVVNPILARAAAFADDRFVPVMDPNDPEKVVLMRAADAARAGVGTPASIGFQTDKAITKYMTSGPGATNLNYFNTATDHLRLLSEAADALNNGEVQRLNQAANAYATETGDPAPTDFNTIKNAVAGEVSKTFKGLGASDEEVALINQTLNSSMSPDQLHGAINYYLRLMDGKLNALRAQYAAGKSGQPAFPENVTPGAPPAGAPPKTPAPAGGAVLLSAAMRVYQQNHPSEKNVTKQTVINDLRKHKVPYVDDVK